jgi:hypothetical protein
VSKVKVKKPAGTSKTRKNWPKAGCGLLKKLKRSKNVKKLAWYLLIVNNNNIVHRSSTCYVQTGNFVYNLVIRRSLYGLHPREVSLRGNWTNHKSRGWFRSHADLRHLDTYFLQSSPRHILKCNGLAVWSFLNIFRNILRAAHTGNLVLRFMRDVYGFAPLDIVVDRLNHKLPAKISKFNFKIHEI